MQKYGCPTGEAPTGAMPPPWAEVRVGGPNLGRGFWSRALAGDHSGNDEGKPGVCDPGL